MRYIRVPAPPNGQATNRDAVRSGRPTYPAATPDPATYSSPTTPGGTGRNDSSRTNSAAPVTGDPIGTGPSAAEPGARGALMVTHIVVSVGP
ncbi:hypothetical protein MYCO108962_23525 [Mycobacterium colombiense]